MTKEQDIPRGDVLPDVVDGHLGDGDAVLGRTHGAAPDDVAHGVQLVRLAPVRAEHHHLGVDGDAGGRIVAEDGAEVGGQPLVLQPRLHLLLLHKRTIDTHFGVGRTYRNFL